MWCLLRKSAIACPCSCHCINNVHLTAAFCRFRKQEYICSFLCNNTCALDQVYSRGESDPYRNYQHAPWKRVVFISWSLEIPYSFLFLQQILENQTISSVYSSGFTLFFFSFHCPQALRLQLTWIPWPIKTKWNHKNQKLRNEKLKIPIIKQRLLKLTKIR